MNRKSERLRMVYENYLQTVEIFEDPSVREVQRKLDFSKFRTENKMHKQHTKDEFSQTELPDCESETDLDYKKLSITVFGEYRTVFDKDQLTEVCETNEITFHFKALVNQCKTLSNNYNLTDNEVLTILMANDGDTKETLEFFTSA